MRASDCDRASGASERAREREGGEKKKNRTEAECLVLWWELIFLFVFGVLGNLVVFIFFFFFLSLSMNG